MGGTKLNRTYLNVGSGSEKNSEGNIPIHSFCDPTVLLLRYTLHLTYISLLYANNTWQQSSETVIKVSLTSHNRNCNED
jgi:hypothetical protein